MDIFPETTKSIEIQAISADIEESNVTLRLTVIDTPGFGDFMNNEESWKPIIDNIEARYNAYMEQESRVNRKKMVDTRVHALLYFIAPTGHSVKPLDIEFMRRLHHRVNLIPIIAKSDTLTEEEVKAFKQRILDDLTAHKIRYYLPRIYDGDDPETIAESREIVERIPFAVVGADKEIDIGNGRRIRGRKYPWGVIDVDNEDHCDFVKLRQLLIRTHMEEMKEYTTEVLYEAYRSQKMAEQGGDAALENTNPLIKFEEEKAAHEAKMAKMEAEMRAVFQQKVAERERKLKESEEELYIRHRQMKETLEQQKAQLEEQKRRLESGIRPGTPEKTRKNKGIFGK